MISKDLLSEVLNEKVSGYIIDEQWVDIQYEDTSSGTFNIYELAHKCKEWALQNGYHITTLLYDENANRIYTHGLATVHYSDDNSNYNEVFSCDASTEPEAIFKAYQWILDNKDKQ